jgi:hypothetical protein
LRVLHGVELEEDEDVVRVVDAAEHALAFAFSRACGRSWSNIGRHVS